MRKIGKVKYNEKSTADLGVIVSGEASFDAAAPDYTSYQIPGKNGDLMLSNNRFLNIDVTYPAFIPADFEEKVQAIRSWMRSARSYARIEDNYDHLHFRMGMGKDVLTFEPSAENEGSNMSLVFDCKPQRFLYSGEEEKEIGVWGPTQTASGDVVSFEDEGGGAFKELTAAITPTQDLHGYEHPWPAGGGKNKAKLTVPAVQRGLTFTLNDDGSMHISGKATSSGGIYINDSAYDTNQTPIIPAGTYTVSVESFPTSGIASNTRLVVYAKYADNTTVGFSPLQISSGSGMLRKSTVATTDPFKFAMYMYVNEGDEFDYTMKLQMETGETQTTWEPYSNVCPISGKTAANVYHAGRNLFTTGGAPGGSSTSAGITFAYNADGTITLNGRNNGSSMSVSTHMTKFRLPPGTYKKPIFRERVGVYVQRKVSSSVWETVSGGSIANTTFTITEDDAKYDLAVRIGVGSGLDFDFDNFVCEPYIYKNGEPLTYENPNYTSYPVSWQTEAGEVYGGTVDVVSGELVVDKIGFTIDGNAISPQVGGNVFPEYVSDAYPWWQFRIGSNITYLAYLIDRDGLSETSCNQLTYNSGGLSTLRPGQFRLSAVQSDGSTIFQFVLPNQPTTVEGLKAVLAVNPIQVVYKLATPQTYQLTRQQILPLQGQNNVWANSGAVTAEWGEDPFGLYNPTIFDAMPLIKVKNPQNGCAVTVNGTTMTCLRRYTGAVTIDCELMDVSSGATNLNADWSKDFPKLSPGENSVAFSGADAVTIIPRWWEL